MRDKRFWRFAVKNLDTFIVRYEWKDAINYRIVEIDEGSVDKSDFVYAPARMLTEVERYCPVGDKEYATDFARSYFLKAKDWMRTFIKNRLVTKEIFDVYKILACPLCKTRVSKRGGCVVCSVCNLRYPIINDIPYMLEEKCLPFHQ